MKYKNVCCMLSAMLVFYPQCIQAETQPEYASEAQAAEENYLKHSAVIRESQEEIEQEESVQHESVQEENPQEEENGEMRSPEDNQNTEQTDVEEQTECLEDTDYIGSEDDITGENLEGEQEQVETEPDEEPESEREGTENEDREYTKITDELSMMDTEDEKGAMKNIPDVPEEERNIEHEDEKRIIPGKDTQRIPVRLKETQEKEYREEIEPVSLKLQSNPHPRVVLQNIRQLSANSGKVKPFIIVENPSSDTECLEVTLESKSRGILPQQVNIQKIDGKTHYTLPEIDDDDQYVLRIKSFDSDAVYEEAVVFSVNQAGTHFLYEREKADVYLNDGFTPCIRLINVDTTEVVSCLVNGREVSYLKQDDQITISEECLKEGKNQIIVAVRDQAGNVSLMEPWEFMIAHPNQKIKEESAAFAKKSENCWNRMIYDFIKRIGQLLKSMPFSGR